MYTNIVLTWADLAYVLDNMVKNWDCDQVNKGENQVGALVEEEKEKFWVWRYLLCSVLPRKKRSQMAQNKVAWRGTRVLLCMS